MNDAPPRQTIRLADYRPPDHLIDRVDLRIAIRPGETLVTAHLAIRRNAHTPPETPLHLDGEGLELIDIALDDTPLAAGDWQLDAHGLTLPHVPERFTLVTTARIHPERNTALEGLYVSNGIWCTQCEAEGFRRITWFVDRPDVLARFSTTIEADRATCPVLLSNGNRIATGSLPDGRHFAQWEDPFPKPCYLYALVAGDLACLRDRHVTPSGRDVTLELYLAHGDEARGQHALASLKKAMRWDEERFGLEYDLDIYMVVAIADFNMGAMENKGLNIFNARYVLASPETATDADYEAIEAVIGHEYFHNWTGNRVTCRDWFQLSLKEGLTVFREQEFSADMGSAPVKRLHDVATLRSHQFPEDAGPLAHPVRPPAYEEINNFYTATVYNKGAEVVRMVHTLLGRETFARGLHRYLTDNDGRAATVEDFIAAMCAVHPAFPARDFMRWYAQAGTPVLSASTHHDPATRSFTLTLAQHCPPTPDGAGKDPFVIPVVIGLLDHHGRPLPATLAGGDTSASGEHLLVLREARRSFVFEGVDEAPVVSLLRDFTAPVEIDFPRPLAELQLLLGRDTDPFCRWDAAQTLLLGQIRARYDDPQGADTVPLPASIADAFRAVLVDAAADPALRAALLGLPDEGRVGERIAAVDPVRVHAAWSALQRSLAHVLETPLHEWLERLAPRQPYRYEPADCARRALAARCLDLLLATESEAACTLALRRFHAADNMTDALAALGALARRAVPGRDEALAAFEARWKHDPLVLDKWFALQAGASLPDTLATVTRLMRHPAFRIDNPNRVRALLGSFARNPACFHAADGSGYRFIAERVGELDRINPQVAARLATSFNRWRHVEPGRRALMRATLDDLAGIHGLSRDTAEIVGKALGT